jgi:tellurite resistance protein TehA-like permease
MRQNDVEIGPVGEKKRFYDKNATKSHKGDPISHYTQHSSKNFLPLFFFNVFLNILPYILYNTYIIILYYRIIFRISNTVLYIILYIYYIERNKKERKYRKFHFLYVSIYL